MPKILQGIVTAPILFAIEEFPELRLIVNQGFEKSSNVDRVSLLCYLIICQHHRLVFPSCASLKKEKCVDTSLQSIEPSLSLSLSL